MGSGQSLKPPKSVINKVSKLSWLLLIKYLDVNNFKVSQCIAKRQYHSALVTTVIYVSSLLAHIANYC